MALERAFRQLSEDFERLYEALDGLRLAVTEDQPRGDSVALLDLLGDASIDMLGWLREAQAAAEDARSSVADTPDLYRARRTLTACQENFNRVSERFDSDLVSYERLEELTSLGRERGREWRAWAEGVKRVLDGCRRPLHDANQSLFRCWQELTARVGASSVSVRNTNIGQQVEVRDGGGVEGAT